MRVSLISTVLSLGAGALSQDLGSLPTCAQTVALTAATNSGCASLTAECLCQNSGFVASLEAAIQNGCSGADQQSACAWGNSACSAYGVSIPCSGSSNVAATTSPADSNPSVTASNNDAGTATPLASTGMGGTSSAGSTSMSLCTGVTNGMTSSSSAPATLMTSTMAMNGTMTHTSAMNSTPVAHTSNKPTSSNITSGATSQYTGAASAVVDTRTGIFGVSVGMMLVLGFF